MVLNWHLIDFLMRSKNTILLTIHTCWSLNLSPSCNSYDVILITHWNTLIGQYLLTIDENKLITDRIPKKRSMVRTQHWSIPPTHQYLIWYFTVARENWPLSLDAVLINYKRLRQFLLTIISKWVNRIDYLMRSKVRSKLCIRSIWTLTKYCYIYHINRSYLISY